MTPGRHATFLPLLGLFNFVFANFEERLPAFLKR